MSQVIFLPTVDTQPMQGSAPKHKEALQKEQNVKNGEGLCKEDFRVLDEQNWLVWWEWVLHMGLRMDKYIEQLREKKNT